MTYERFDNETSYRNGLVQVVACAQHTVRVFDQNLAGMGFEATDMQGALQSFIERDRNNRLHIALHDTDDLKNHMPRTLNLIQRFSHAIEVRHVPGEYRHLADCHLLADAQHGIRRFHADQPRGALLLNNPEEVRSWWNRFDDLWEQSRYVSLGEVTGL